ncbi:MAG: hypothetical protein ABIF71_13515 [Planctomycetota bacterium]
MRISALCILALLAAAAALRADVLVDTGRAVRLDPPFVLETGRPGSPACIAVDRALAGTGEGTAAIPVTGLAAGMPYRLWARVWWASSGTARFTVEAGGARTIAGGGFAADWTWVAAPEAVTFETVPATIAIRFGDGGFAVDQLLFAADQAAMPEGRVAGAPAAGAGIYFSDDFMRDLREGTPDLGTWQSQAGTWHQYKIADVQRGGKSSQAERSANGFALLGQAAPEVTAVILNGDAGWRDYRVQGSVCLNGPGAAGPVFGWQDPDHYYFFAVAAGTESTRLVRVWGGTAEVLRTADLRVDTGDHYAFTVESVAGTIVCSIDDTEVFRLRECRLLAGRAGLACSPGAAAVFDDIFISSSRFIVADFREWEDGRWNKVRGEWWIRWPRGSAGLFASLDARYDPAAEAPCLIARGTDGLFVMGDASWDRYRAGATCRPPAAGDTAGLVFNYRGEQDHWVFAAAARREGAAREPRLRVEVRRVTAAGAAVVESADLPATGGPVALGAALEPQSVILTLDGRTLFKVRDPGLTGGGFGLTATSVAGQAFDGVRVDFAPRPEPEVWSDVVPRFIEEDSMQNWAREASDWTAGADGLLHNGKDFFGDVTVTARVTDPARTYALRVHDLRDGTEGYRFTLAPAEGGGLQARIARAGAPAAAAVVPAADLPAVWKDGVAIALVKEGHYLSGLIAGRPAVEFRDPAPLPEGTRVAADVPGVKPDTIAVNAPTMLNYYFTHSPVDWYARGGEWKVTNRWKCDPRWSWFGGRSESAAALWNKRELAGDFTIDLFMSMQMDTADALHYFHPGDMNITVCGDGENPGSGYAFIFGGERGIETRIMRAGVTVAETVEPLFLPPSTRDERQPMERGLHRRWFHFTVVRQGDLFEYYLDNRRMLSFQDPQPLAGRRFGIWTYDNGIMVARIRVTAAEVSDRRTVFAALPSAPAAEPSLPPAVPAVVSATHPLGLESAAARREWILREAARAAGLKPYAAVVTPADAAGRTGVLRVANRCSGGRYSLKLFEGDRPAAELARLEFGWLCDQPRVRVDLFLQTSAGWFGYHVTGDSAPFRPGNPPFYPTMLGDLGLAADGTWQAVSLDIYNGFYAFLGEGPARALRVQGVFLAAGSYGYTDAGVTGNFRDDAYCLDQPRFAAPGGNAFKIGWPAGPAGTVFAFGLDRDPATLPDPATAVDAIEFTASNLAAGAHWFHLRSVAADGTAGPAAHYRVDVDRTAPTVAAIAVDPQGADIRFDESESGIDWSSIDLLAGATPLRWGPWLAVRPPGDRARLDLAAAGVVLDEGLMNISVVGVRDRAGNVLPAPARASRGFAFTDDTVPPTAAFAIKGYLAENKWRFEDAADQWVSQVGDKVAVLWDRNTAAAGRASMTLVNTGNASSFQVQATRAFDASEFPVLSFAYRLEPDVRINLALGGNPLGPLNIGFADNNRNSRTFGAIGGVVRDGGWHTALVPVHRLLAAYADTIPSLRFGRLYFEDIEWRAADPLTRFGIDDFFLHKVYDNSGGTMCLWVTARDASGIAALRWRLQPLEGQADTPWQVIADPRPDTDGDIPVPIPAGVEGFLRLEACAEDRAGNRSPVISFPLLLDNTGPAVSGLAPAPDAAAATGIITAALTDAVAGIKRDRITMEINGRRYNLLQPGLEYAGRSGALVFDLRRTGPGAIFPDGQAVRVGIYAEDGVGHPVKQAWTWKMDYSRDTVAPPAPYLTRLPCLDGLETFETGSGFWRDRSGDQGGRVEVTAETAALGTRSLRVTNRTDGGTHDCFVRTEPFDGLQYGRVALDYRMPEGTGVDFLVLVDGTWYAIGFGGRDNQYETIGTVPCIADGAWHHAAFDLGAMLRAKFPGRTTVTVRNFIMGDWARPRHTKAGAVFDVDNFTLHPAAAANPGRFGWSEVYDPTGIREYLYTAAAGAAAPPAASAGRATLVEIAPPAAGPWFFSLAARDGNNNLSPVAVFGPCE